MAAGNFIVASELQTTDNRALYDVPLVTIFLLLDRLKAFKSSLLLWQNSDYGTTSYQKLLFITTYIDELQTTPRSRHI
jgi:hypothetical protein